MTPTWVTSLLNARAFQLLARVVLTTPFWAACIQHTIGWKDWMGTMAHFNLHPPVLLGLLSIVTLLVGTVLVVFSNKWAWLGAGALAVFTALTIPIAHAFWSMQGQAAMTEFYTVLEHISIIGGLMLAAILASREPRA